MNAIRNDNAQRRYPFVLDYNEYQEIIVTSHTTFRAHIVEREELCDAIAQSQTEWPLILIMNNVSLAYDPTFTSETKGIATIEHVADDVLFNGHDSYTVVITNSK